MISQARHILKNTYGYENFNKGQIKIIESILEKRDTLGIMATGAGKSVCYQIPALIFNGLTIVVSPLISLMKDQVDALKIIGIKSAFLNSSLSKDEYLGVIRKILKREIKILYIAPERLVNENFISIMKKTHISLIAVDEAHCISQWGHDFRKTYLSIPTFIENLNRSVQIVAFTATATTRVKKDIVEKLNMKDTMIHVDSFDRKNLFFSVVNNVKSEAFIIDYLKKNRKSSGIIYCSTRKEVDSIFSYLNLRGHNDIGKYHGGLDKSEREFYQNDFINDKIRLMIATNAFGMGIDKSNIRFVIHSNIPKDIESYYQEAGRAGRDGAPSEAILIFKREDIIIQKYLINSNSESDETVKYEKLNKLESMIEYAELTTCYREFILKYFGERIIKDYCGNCSSCLKIKDVENLTIEAKKVISCVGRSNQNLGISTITNILLGRADSKMKNKELHKFSTFGIMKDSNFLWLEDFINFLISERFLEQGAGSFPVLKLGTRYKEILSDKFKLIRKNNQKLTFDYYENELFKRLNTLRTDIAETESVAPYVIFSDLTLIEMSEIKPVNRWEMLKIRGVGNQKFNNYGEQFIDIIKEHISHN